MIRLGVADDSAEIRSLFKIALSIYGDVEVVAEASDGVEAIALAEYSPIDVLLLDLSMPGFDGFEVLRKIRKSNEELKIIVFSGFSYDQMAKTVLDAGADAYVEKGVALEQLCQIVEALVPGFAPQVGVENGTTRPPNQRASTSF